MTFHCLIVGSRCYTDYASFKAKCDALLVDKTDLRSSRAVHPASMPWRSVMLTSLGDSLQIFPAEWSRYGKRAGYVRNREMHSISPPMPTEG